MISWCFDGINRGLLRRFCKCLSWVDIVGWVMLILFVVMDIFLCFSSVFSVIKSLKLFCLIFMKIIFYI